MGAVFDKISGLLFRHSLFWYALFAGGAAYIFTQDVPVYGIVLGREEKTILIAGFLIFCVIFGVITRALSVWLWRRGPYAYASQTAKDVRAVREHVGQLAQQCSFGPDENYRRHLRACGDYVARMPMPELRQSLLEIMAYGADIAVEKDRSVYKALEKRLTKLCKAFLRQTDWVHHYK